MYLNQVKFGAAALMCLSAFSSSFAGSMGEVKSPFSGHFLVQIGGYSGIQGEAQNIRLRDTSVRNRYTVKTHNQGSGLVGIGYMLDGPAFIQDKFPISYGINTFFLGQTEVTGRIINESSLANLAYRYKIRNIPVYFDVKTLVNVHNTDKVKLALDVGIGPNFMSASRYFETPITPGAVPMNAFSSHEEATFSTTVGASLRFNNEPGHLPLEIGYRFFYLGDGHLNIKNHAVAHHLKTGSNYANALVFTVTM